MGLIRLFGHGMSKLVSAPIPSSVRPSCTQDLLITKQNASEKPFLDLCLASDGHTALAASTDRTMNLFEQGVPTFNDHNVLPGIGLVESFGLFRFVT